MSPLFREHHQGYRDVPFVSLGMSPLFRFQSFVEASVIALLEYAESFGESDAPEHPDEIDYIAQHTQLTKVFSWPGRSEG